jgi:hypothetical protein
MFSKEVIAMLKEVIFSWQVIAVTIAIVLYLKIVFYTARSYHRPRVKLSEKIKFKKKKSEPEPVLADDGESESDSNNDLGLEESE